MTFSVTDIVCFPLLNNKFLFGIGPPYIYFHNYIILGKAKKREVVSLSLKKKY